MSTRAALRVDGLHKSYGAVRALEGLSFEVPAGSLACLIGPNGAGKSTAMRIIAGLQLADGGEVHIAGESVGGRPERARALCGITPQELQLFALLSAQETLHFVAALRGLEPERRDAEIERWLALTSLQDARGRMVGELSGGMKRKLAVAAAMLTPLPLVILDESFTGLDPESTRALQRELRRWCDAGGAVLLSSHILAMVEGMADQVILMARGRVLRCIEREALGAELAERGEDLTDLYLRETGAGAGAVDASV